MGAPMGAQRAVSREATREAQTAAQGAVPRVATVATVADLDTHLGKNDTHSTRENWSICSDWYVLRTKLHSRVAEPVVKTGVCRVVVEEVATKAVRAGAMVVLARG